MRSISVTDTNSLRQQPTQTKLSSITMTSQHDGLLGHENQKLSKVSLPFNNSSSSSSGGGGGGDKRLCAASGDAALVDSLLNQRKRMRSTQLLARYAEANREIDQETVLLQLQSKTVVRNRDKHGMPSANITDHSTEPVATPEARAATFTMDNTPTSAEQGSPGRVPATSKKCQKLQAAYTYSSEIDSGSSKSTDKNAEGSRGCIDVGGSHKGVAVANVAASARAAILPVSASFQPVVDQRPQQHPQYRKLEESAGCQQVPDSIRRLRDNGGRGVRCGMHKSPAKTSRMPCRQPKVGRKPQFSDYGVDEAWVLQGSAEICETRR